MNQGLNKYKDSRMDTAIFISSTNFIMFTIVYNYYYFVNISKRYTTFQLFLSVILSAIIIYLELIFTDDFQVRFLYVPL